MAACGSIPTRILLPLGAMSQLQQLSCSPNRLSQDKEPRRMPTFSLSLPHLSFQMLMKARKIPRNSPSGDSAAFPALDQPPIPVNPGGGKFRSGNVPSTEFPRKGAASKQLTGSIPWATVTRLCNSYITKAMLWSSFGTHHLCKPCWLLVATPLRPIAKELILINFVFVPIVENHTSSHCIPFSRKAMIFFLPPGNTMVGSLSNLQGSSWTDMLSVDISDCIP